MLRVLEIMADSAAIRIVYNLSSRFDKTEFTMSQSPVVGGKAFPLALLNLRGEIQHARLKRVSVSPRYRMCSLKRRRKGLPSLEKKWTLESGSGLYVPCFPTGLTLIKFSLLQMIRLMSSRLDLERDGTACI